MGAGRRRGFPKRRHEVSTYVCREEREMVEMGTHKMGWFLSFLLQQVTINKYTNISRCAV